jgi:hypothetical protein
VPSGYPAGQPPRAPRKRPSAWWFGLGIGLLVAAAVAGVGLFVWTLHGFLDTDARIHADGRVHRVSVGTGDQLMAWVEDGTGDSCSILDTETGEPVPRQSTGGSYTRSDSGGDWHGAFRFDPGSGELEITCDGQGTVLLGAAPRFGSFFLSILATILVPGFLGLAGVVVLIVTGILWSTRPARV